MLILGRRQSLHLCRVEGATTLLKEENKMIRNNGFLITITVPSSVAEGQKVGAQERTSFSPKKFKEPEILPVQPVEGLDLRMCISAGEAYLYGEAHKAIPAGATGTYFCKTGDHNVEITLKED